MYYLLVIVVSVTQKDRGIHFNLTLLKVADVVRLELGMYKSLRATDVRAGGCDDVVTFVSAEIPSNKSRLIGVTVSRSRWLILGVE